MIDKYLPIGSVVLLKGGKKRIMINGFGCKSDEENFKIFDYIGCLYPEGITDFSTILAFNHEEIEHIFFMGCIDEEEKEFKKYLPKAIENFTRLNAIMDSSVNNNDTKTSLHDSNSPSSSQSINNSIDLNMVGSVDLYSTNSDKKS